MAELTQDILYAIPRKNAEASTEITYGYLVKWDTNGCKICTTSDVPMGVAMKATFEDSNNVVRVIDATHTVGNIRVGDYATVCQLGVCTAKLGTGDSVTAGSPIALSDTNNGCVDGWVAGRDCLGYALETSSTAGDVKVFISTVEPVAIPSLTAYLTSATAATTYQELCGYQELTDDGAVTAQTGLCHLNKGSAIAATLVAPPSAGLRLEITSETAQAHTVAAAAPGIGGGGANTATFGGTAYDTITLISWNNSGTLQWEIASKTGVTVA